MNAQLDLNMGTERMLSMLTGSFAALATLLAALGLYGVLAFNVARRTREIGIRMALGASAGHVRRLVVRDVLLMIGIGGLVGIGSAAAAGKLVESVLYQMKPWDPLVCGAAAQSWAPLRCLPLTFQLGARDTVDQWSLSMRDARRRRQSQRPTSTCQTRNCQAPTANGQDSQLPRTAKLKGQT
jgi:hypothetical protein